jgi:transposase-like protein
MARLNDSEYFRRMLLGCLTEADPLLKMLQWVAERLAETEAFWGTVFESLKTCGLQRVWLVAADAHRGIQNAARRHFLGSTHQRYKVPLMRNVLAMSSTRTRRRLLKS